MRQAWYHNAIFYSLDVETFYDSKSDGIGDFHGLIEKLDCIAGLGANCIWLLPFYPSPNRDNGYDVMDYYNVDPRLGTLGDFSQFLGKAEQLGLRVIIDLVVNHTSIEHPWFQLARRDKQSQFRNYYVWSDEPIKYEKEHLMFQGEENSVWTYDEVAQQYYLHRFYKWQPDLNVVNPKVKEEILKIMEFWLRLGVNGFRIDAAQLLVEPYGLKGADKEDLLNFIDEMRDYAQSQRSDVLLLAEVNSGPEEMMTYFKAGERMHMLFNFFLNQHLFLALADQNKLPLEKALRALPPMDQSARWLNFLRHHDELNLRLLSKDDQEKIFRAFAPDDNMRIYGFGIRRRLAPMMNGNIKKIQLAYSLLFSMPGAQMIRYGDEIGMGDDLSLKGRNSVRTPMQWSAAKNGGFSNAEEKLLVHPVLKSGPFGYKKVNLFSAQQQPSSLLNWVERLITTRKGCPEIGYGNLFIIPNPNEKLLIHGFQWEEKKLFFLHNLSEEEVQISKEEFSDGKLFDVFGEELHENEGSRILLKSYGYRWYRSEKN